MSFVACHRDACAAFDCNLYIVTTQSSTLARNITQFRGDQPQRIAALAAKHLRQAPQRVSTPGKKVEIRLPEFVQYAVSSDPPQRP